MEERWWTDRVRVFGREMVQQVRVFGTSDVPCSWCLIALSNAAAIVGWEELELE